MKTYIALSVHLSGVPPGHRATNNNCQYTILVRAKSQKRVAEILDMGLSHLRNFGGIREAQGTLGYKNAAVAVTDIATKDEQVYYHVEHTKSGWVGQWFEYHKGKPSVPVGKPERVGRR